MPENDPAASVVRARRLKIVDESGHVRVTLAAKAALSEGDAEGLRFFDREGSQVISLVLQHDGAVPSFAVGGNTTAELGARTDHPYAVAAGAYLVLCDTDGKPRAAAA